ncbi:MAG: 6-hydroxymethylpterin diphosphokinase MptE-like protein [Methanothrix sp.]
MRFEDWEIMYKRILEDFGFSRSRDEEAACVLSSLLESIERITLSDLQDIIRGRDVVVCGNAPRLREEVKKIKPPDAVVAADGATSVLLENGLIPDIIVTDLDGCIPDIIESNRRGSAVVVHAHGDNIDKLKEHVPHMRRVLGTAQSSPLKNVHNFGGFTDGDRAVFLALELMPKSIKLIGFDLDDQSVTPRKSKKLRWAKALLEVALGPGCTDP